MNEISNYIIMEYFRKNADQFDLDEGEIRILIQYYKCLFMGFLMEWLDNNLKSDLEKKCVRLPGFLKSTRSYMRY